MSTVQIRTYDSHNYSAIDQQIQDLRREYAFKLQKEKLIGHGITEHKICGQIVTIGWRTRQICDKIPSSVLNEHVVYVAAQAKE